MGLRRANPEFKAPLAVAACLKITIAEIDSGNSVDNKYLPPSGIALAYVYNDSVT